MGGQTALWLTLCRQARSFLSQPHQRKIQDKHQFTYHGMREDVGTNAQRHIIFNKCNTHFLSHWKWSMGLQGGVANLTYGLSPTYQHHSPGLLGGAVIRWLHQACWVTVTTASICQHLGTTQFHWTWERLEGDGRIWGYTLICVYISIYLLYLYMCVYMYIFYIFIMSLYVYIYFMCVYTYMLMNFVLPCVYW